MLVDKLPKSDFTGWVLLTTQDQSLASVRRSAFRRRPTTTTPQRRASGPIRPRRWATPSARGAPAKFFRETELWVKTKEPVTVLRTDNEIPRRSRGTHRLPEDGLQQETKGDRATHPMRFTRGS